MDPYCTSRAFARLALMALMALAAAPPAAHAPAGTPAAVIARLSDAIGAALQQPELRRKFLELGLEPAGSTLRSFESRLRKDEAGYAKIIREADIKVE